MTRRLMHVGVLVSTFGILCVQYASAGMITAASASGPGGTVTNRAIDSFASTDDSVRFDANYTALAPINFNLTIDGPGQYYLGLGVGFITNSTTSLFGSFDADLVTAPAGSTFDASGWDGAVFSNGATMSPPFPNATSVTFNGPPGLGPNATTDLYVGFLITAGGSNSVQIAMTPSVSFVPEPSTFALGLIGAIGSVGYWACRCRRLGGTG